MGADEYQAICFFFRRLITHAPTSVVDHNTPKILPETLRDEKLALSSIYLTPTAGPTTEYGSVAAARVWAWFIRHHRHALYAAHRAAREMKMSARM
jgi:hypothetical protein